jgi:hypothetical protein
MVVDTEINRYSQFKKNETDTIEKAFPSMYTNIRENSDLGVGIF